MKALFWLGIMVLTQIFLSRFKQSKISPLIPHIYVLGCFVNFLGDFWVYLGINSFSQRISKINRNKNFKDLILKIARRTPTWVPFSNNNLY